RNALKTLTCSNSIVYDIGRPNGRRCRFAAKSTGDHAMDAYVAALQQSSIPFHPLGLIAVWAAAFGTAQLVIWQGGKCRQAFMAIVGSGGLVRGLSVRLVVGQILLDAFVLALALVGGGAAVVF